MRNNLLIAVCIVLIICLNSSYSYAQFISNKISFSAGYQTGGFQGSKTINENNFIYPSLYSNFNNLNGFSLKMLYNSSKHFGFGISFSHLQTSNWQYPDSMLYQESQLIMQSISADIQIHPKLSESGVWNRIKLFLDISPTVGISKLSLKNPLFDIYEGNNSIAQPEKSNDIYYGLKGNMGAEVSLNQMIGLFIDYSFGYYLVSSKMYSDNHFASSILEAGIVVRLMKNKRYFY